MDPRSRAPLQPRLGDVILENRGLPHLVGEDVRVPRGHMQAVAFQEVPTVFITKGGQGSVNVGEHVCLGLH